MRYAFFLLIFVFATGCAHNRLRLIKVDKSERTEIAQEESKKDRAPYTGKKQEVITVSEEAIAGLEKAEEIETTQSEVTSETINATDAIETEPSVVPEQVPDRIEQGPSDSEKAALALAAEKDANIAKGTLIASIILFILPFISIALFISGSIFLSRSNRSNYITPKGQRSAKVARIAQIIYAVLILAIIAFILAVIFL